MKISDNYLNFQRLRFERAQNTSGRKRSSSVAFTAPTSNQARLNRRAVHYRQLTNMRTRTYRRGRMFARRGKRRSRGASMRGMGKRVKRLEDTAEETKHIIFSDSGITGSNAAYAGGALISGTAVQLHINPLSRGTTVQSRVGDKAVFTRIHFKVQANFSTNIVSVCTVFWILYKVKNGNAGVVTANNFLLAKYGVAPAMRTLPDINNQNNPNLNILARGQWTNIAPTDASIEEHVFNIDYRKAVHTEYRLGNAGTVADINKNALYLLLWTDTGATGITVYGEGHVFYHG